MGAILVTGALGQIGSELVPALRARHGADNVVASDVRMVAADNGGGPFEIVDCTDQRQLQEVVHRYGVDTIYHLAALLSAVAEDKPQMAWQLNMDGLYAVLELARQNRCTLFIPSSIAAFGPATPRDATPQDTIQRPTTIYGVTKVAGELLCDYYAKRFAMDTRGLRLPGVISHVAPPGGGTTDYAVDIFDHAVRYGRYTCFVRPDTRLDMMYMPDVIKAIMQLMDADSDRLLHRNAFNITAMNVTPEDLADAIRAHVTDFAVDYQVDPVRQEIADSWPRSVDDSAARSEWGWSPDYDLAAMTGDMLDKFKAKLKAKTRTAG